MKKSEERRRWEAAILVCHLCRWKTEKKGVDLCPAHHARDVELYAAESQNVLSRSKAGPLPPPPALPPRRPTRFE